MAAFVLPPGATRPGKRFLPSRGGKDSGTLSFSAIFGIGLFFFAGITGAPNSGDEVSMLLYQTRHMHARGPKPTGVLSRKRPPLQRLSDPAPGAILSLDEAGCPIFNKHV